MKYFQNISNLWGNVLTALGNTVYISLIAIVLGTVLGIAMGVVLTYCKKRWQWLFRIYVDIMRGLPVLVTIFVVYYFVNAVLKMLFGVQMEQNTAGAVALTMFAAAPMSTVYMPTLAKPCAVMNAFMPSVSSTKSVPNA